MQIKEFLNNVCEQIQYKPIRNEIYEELENHINEKKETYIESGLADDIAEQNAIEQMGNSVEIGKSLNKIHRPKLDWKLSIITIIAICFGFLVAIARNTNYEIGLYENGIERLFNAPILFTIACVLGIILGIGVYFFNYKKLQKYATLTYIIATIIGIFINNFGTIYIPILNIRNQIPKILPMFLYIIAFTGFIQNINDNKGIINKKIKILLFNNISIKIIKIIILSMFSLIVISNISSILILGLTYLIISTVKLLKVKGNKRKYITVLWGLPIILSIIYFSLFMGNSFKINDNKEFIFYDSYDIDNQIKQDQIIKSAKIFGPTINIDETSYNYNQGTNYAFISVLVNYGWSVTILMVLTIILFSVKVVINSTKIKDMYGKLIIVGISCIFILQSVLNLLMNLNLGLKTSVNMPFISYGGFEMIINILLLSLILSIYRRKDIILKNVSTLVE